MGRRTGRENKMPGKRPNDNTYELFESKIIMNWLNSVLQRTVVWFLWENCISVKQRQWDLANAIWQSSLLWAWATRPASANGVYTDVTLPRWAEAWMGRSGLAQVSLLMPPRGQPEFQGGKTWGTEPSPADAGWTEPSGTAADSHNHK